MTEDVPAPHRDHWPSAELFGESGCAGRPAYTSIRAAPRGHRGRLQRGPPAGPTAQRVGPPAASEGFPRPIPPESTAAPASVPRACLSNFLLCSAIQTPHSDKMPTFCATIGRVNARFVFPLDANQPRRIADRTSEFHIFFFRLHTSCSDP